MRNCQKGNPRKPNETDKIQFLGIIKATLTKRLEEDLEKELAKNDKTLQHDFVPYCLRHTYCTHLAEIGVDIRIAQRLMGHSSIKMTADIYTHINNEQIEKARQLIDMSLQK